MSCQKPFWRNVVTSHDFFQNISFWNYTFYVATYITFTYTEFFCKHSVLSITKMFHTKCYSFVDSCDTFFFFCHKS